jgi:hypothetical protein
LLSDAHCWGGAGGGGDVPESSVSLMAVKRQIPTKVQYALNLNGREGNQIWERVLVLSCWKQKEL